MPTPYAVKWKVVNSGDEAESANDTGHVAVTENLTRWEQTAYRGRHEMICEIVKAGEIRAASKFVVNIR